MRGPAFSPAWLPPVFCFRLAPAALHNPAPRSPVPSCTAAPRSPRHVPRSSVTSPLPGLTSPPPHPATPAVPPRRRLPAPGAAPPRVAAQREATHGAGMPRALQRTGGVGWATGQHGSRPAGASGEFARSGGAKQPPSPALPGGRIAAGSGARGRTPALMGTDGPGCARLLRCGLLAAEPFAGAMDPPAGVTGSPHAGQGGPRPAAPNPANCIPGPASAAGLQRRGAGIYVD